MGRRERREKKNQGTRANLITINGGIFTKKKRVRKKTKKSTAYFSAGCVELKQNEYNSATGSYPTGQIRNVVLPGAVKKRLLPCVILCLYLILIVSHKHAHAQMSAKVLVGLCLNVFIGEDMDTGVKWVDRRLPLPKVRTVQVSVVLILLHWILHLVKKSREYQNIHRLQVK